MDKLTILFISCLSFFITHSDAVLNWSKSYNLKATLTISSAQVNEPYEVWVSEKSRKARVDFYGGIDKLYREVSVSKVTYYKVFPETTESVQNKMTCEEWIVSPGLSSMYETNTYLPVKDFKFIANDTINSERTQKWQYTTITDKANNQKLIYTMWITLKGKTPIPKRYEYRINLGDTEFELFRHDYEYFDDTEMNSDFYKEVKDLDCSPVTKSANGPLDPLLEFIDPQMEDERIRSEFEKFKTIHKKEYISSSEHNHRKNIFKNNLRYVNFINRQHKSYTLGINQFADLSDEEIAKLSGIKTKKSFNKVKPKSMKYIKKDNHKIIAFDIAETFDWRHYNAITPIKDQTVLCGSCYAFTTAAAIESAAYVNKGCKNLTELSEQAIVDCTWSDNEDDGNIGCLGGTYEYALEWVKNHGIPTKKEYGAYLAQEGLCHIKNMTKLKQIYEYRQIRNGPDMDNNIKMRLKKYGPLLASINISPKSFIFYKSGVYDDTRCRNEEDERNHGVTIVGYGKENGKDYWLIKNSWSQNWGDAGYMKLANAYNVCGVKNFLYYVIFKKNHSQKCFKK